jgi:hypothetical protein
MQGFTDLFYEQHTTFPCQPMFYERPDPYLTPAQSRYFNLGMNGYIAPYTHAENTNPLINAIDNNMSYTTTIYPGRLKGLVGDYGPRQEGYSGHLGYGQYNSYGGRTYGQDNLTATNVYPLDYQGVNGYWAGEPYNKRRKIGVRYNREEERIY